MMHLLSEYPSPLHQPHVLPSMIYFVAIWAIGWLVAVVWYLSALFAAYRSEPPEAHGYLVRTMIREVQCAIIIWPLVLVVIIVWAILTLLERKNE
jgi:hypothetical protein